MKSLSLALSFYLAAASYGQSQPAEISTELVALSLGGNVPTYYYGNGENIIKLDVSQQGISYPVPYHGQALLSLFEDPSDLAPHDPEDPELIPSLQVPLQTGENRVLLLFSKSGTEKESHPHVRALGLSTEKMKPGDYRAYNFSKGNAYLMINKAKTLIHSGKSYDLSAPDWQSDISDMQVKLGIKQDENMRQVYSSVWGHMPARRTFLFIFDNPDRFRPIRVFRFHDAPIKPPSKSEE